MANIKSSKKRIRVAQANTNRNKPLRSNLKSVIRAADFALANDAPDKADAVAIAIKALDEVTSKGIIHKNNAARKKSSLMKRLNASNA
ncbi:MAG: 30S ribosomal protein S20 [Clostridiales bacterium]|nr:30S ribosomal protein S20 [Clostridiales bacterium]